MTTMNRKKKGQRTVRAYLLRLYPNAGKAEELRYGIYWQHYYTLCYTRRFWQELTLDAESVAGLGKVAAWGQKRARDMMLAGWAAYKATGLPFHCPESAPELQDAVIQKNKKSAEFDYWVKPVLGPWVPAKAHKGLNKALRAGGTLRKPCEVRATPHGAFFVRVFVEFPLQKPVDTGVYLGCDVGVNAGVSRSDGYVGQSLRPIMEKARKRRAEQQRQGHHKSSTRTALKQVLDQEARKAITLAAKSGKTLVLESPKALGNLKPSGSIGGWARRHFGDRTRQIAEIACVAVREEWPAYTSITCLRCGYRDKANRRGTVFACRSCGYEIHADVQAARALTRRAAGRFPFAKQRKSTVTGIETRILSLVPQPEQRDAR
jgi:Putative transposase DNA-binding domain